MQYPRLLDGFSNLTHVIFVISLKRSLERRAKVSEILQDVNFEFFDAIDGKALTSDQSAMVEKYIIPDTLKNPGQIGCFLSHVNLWKLIKNKKLQYCLVMEDDIVKKTAESFEDILEIPKLEKIQGFDIIYIGHCYEKKAEDLQKVESNSMLTIYKSDNPLCTHAYIISQAGVIKLLDYMESRRFDMPIDMVMSQAIKDKSITCYSVYPTLVDQDNIVPSIISDGLSHPWFKA